MGKHSEQTVSAGIHIIHAFDYASESARTSASLVSTDIGKVARQTDTGEFYVLVDTDPTWKQLGGVQKDIIATSIAEPYTEIEASTDTPMGSTIAAP